MRGRERIVADAGDFLMQAVHNLQSGLDHSALLYLRVQRHFVFQLCVLRDSGTQVQCFAVPCVPFPPTRSKADVLKVN